MSPAIRNPGPKAAGNGTIRLTVAQALVLYLASQYSERDGVRRRVIPGMFGIFGHGNLLALGAALAEYPDKMPYYQPKNEQSMVHTAIGYAKASNRLATLACTASIGPGSTNMLTGAATATINRLPVLLLPADSFANRKQGNVLQQLESPAAGDVTVNDAFRPLSRFFDRIARPEQLLTALPEAIRILLDPAETGAVTIALHQDVQAEAYDYPTSFFQKVVWPVARRPAAEEELSVAATAMKQAARPLIIAGGGVRYSAAGRELAALSEQRGIPVCETSAGKGVMEPSALNLGGVGVNGTRAANQIAREADLVICIGTRLTDFTTGSRSLFQGPGVQFLSVNVNSLDAHKLGASVVIADAKLAIQALVQRLESASGSDTAEYRATVENARARWQVELEEDLLPRVGERMTQGQVLRALNEHARAGDVVIAAAGSAPGDLLKSWDAKPGIQTHIEFGYSCMGHELPAALGYRLAEPELGEIYAVIGDGTFLMNPTEIVTAVQEGLKATVILLVNNGFQSIHGLQTDTSGLSFGNEFRRRDGNRLGGEVVDVDYEAVARGLGAEAFEATDLEEFEQALTRARASASFCVIVALVEPRRGLLGSGAGWDLGVPELADAQPADASEVRASKRR